VETRTQAVSPALIAVPVGAAAVWAEAKAAHPKKLKHIHNTLRNFIFLFLLGFFAGCSKKPGENTQIYNFVTYLKSYFLVQNQTKFTDI
jgi:hypothetical protein